MLYSHEGPSRETGVRSVLVTLGGKDTLDTLRADQLDFDITTSSVGNPDLDSDVFQLFEVVGREHVPGNLDCASYSTGHDIFTARRSLEDIHSAILELNDRKVDPCLRLDQFPLLRGLHELDTVDATVTVFVAERTTGCGHLPVGIIGIDMNGRPHAEMLNITPAQVRAKRKSSVHSIQT